MKILIIRFSSIGDIVLTTPVVRCVRKKFPEAKIFYLTKAKHAPILESNPYIDTVIELDDDFPDTINILKDHNFDYVIDLHNNIRTYKIAMALKGIPFVSFNKLNKQKWIYTTFKINMMPDIHIVDRYMEATQQLGVSNDGLGLDFFIPDHETIKEGDIPFSHSQGFVAIVTGAAHVTKKLPVSKLRELCAAINYPIILLGSKEDYTNGVKIADLDTIKIYNACGKFSLNESADILQKAKLVISHDTGLMHIAAAFNKTIFSVWGNTVPSFGMYPYKTVYKNFQVNQLRCRPCSKIGFDKCPKGHFKCMRQQSIPLIAAETHAFLKV